MVPSEAEKEFPLFKSVTDVKSEQRAGKDGKRLVGTGAMPQMPFDEPLPMTMWIDAESGLIGEVTIDLKKAYGDMMQGQMTIDKALGTISFLDAQADAELPADAFVFKPGADDRKVDAFEMDGGPDLQQKLVGQPVPDFKGTDLEGKSIGIADYKGKVVVLDFWATWCPPCMEMIPQIQELSAEYADKGAVVIGMNMDQPNALERVKKTVETKKLTFRQFMDPQGEVADQFKVTGIPCTVLVDGKGVIQWIHTGGGPGVKKDISEKIDKLLKGESLVTAEDHKK
jgi:peroxiredoxin